MNSRVKKKWGSLEEMKKDLVTEVCLGSSRIDDVPEKDLHDFIRSDLYKIVEDAQNAKTSKDFFNATCKLSSTLEKVEERHLKDILNSTNLYVLLLNAVFRNTFFQEKIIEVNEAEVAIFGKSADDLNFESKVFLNAGISLAFFSIATGLTILNESNIAFLRKNLTDIVKYILKISTTNKNFSKLCFKLESISWDNRFHYKDKFPVLLDDKILFDTLRVARSISGVSFLSLTINASLADKFSKIISTADNEDFSLSKSLSDLYGLIHKLEESKRSYYSGFSEKTTGLLETFFDVFVRNNERNQIFLLKKISSDFNHKDGKKFVQLVVEKMSKAELIRQDLVEFAQKNFSAFEGDIGEERYEWSNKIFIASLRLLSVLSGIHAAKDDRWKVSTAVYEYREWLNDVHNILNKYLIEDDWSIIADYVVQETAEIGWKSTFFTPLEQPYISEEIETSIGKKLFDKIIKTILGMLNTSGGTLIVGLIENPDSIVREDLAANIIYKNGKAFFDISNELKKSRKTVDGLRLQIINYLMRITDNSAEKFNDIITIEPVLLKDGDRSATIIKIGVKKTDKHFYNIKKEGETLLWISLTMRADGQTIDVDIRDYIARSSVLN